MAPAAPNMNPTQSARRSLAGRFFEWASLLKGWRGVRGDALVRLARFDEAGNTAHFCSGVGSLVRSFAMSASTLRLTYCGDFVPRAKSA